ncbi:alpha/beta hydrolase family protein [Streptomyces sp. NPDC059176]|uniref:alpha/beta hydrolase family protein n=1 Tax=unclassified Streptomyces TaxID=2593676 RepID=UPI0036CE06AF
MPSFFDLPDILAQFVAVNRSRIHSVGLDPHEYDRVTQRLGSLEQWPDVFRATGHAHRAAAEEYETQGRTVSAGDSFRLAARWLHCAVLLPHPDAALLELCAAEADDAMRRALAHLDPGAVRLEGEEFTGWLRRPGGEPRTPVVVVVPGLDSGKEEFHALTEALLRRGLAVLTMDGPGQGVRAATSTLRADYDQVLTEVIDVLGAQDTVDADRVGVIGLSLGGYFAALGAAREPRIRVAATVSSPYRLDWDELPPYVTETLTQRSGSRAAAEDFTSRVDLHDVAGRIAVPLYVVDGGADHIPGVAHGAPLAASAPHGEYVLVPHGDHLLGNAHADWMPATTDWLAHHLTR